MAEILPDAVLQIIRRSELGANGELVASSEDRRVLYQFTRESWRQFIAQIANRGLSEKEQHKLLVASIESLPEEEYLSFITQALRLFANGQLPMIIGESLLFPSKSDKGGFLAVNYQEPQLGSALRAALPRYASNHEAKAFIERILSGAEKERYTKRMTAQGLQPRSPVGVAAETATPLDSKK